MLIAPLPGLVVLVTGGRAFRDSRHVCSVLDALNTEGQGADWMGVGPGGIRLLVHGGARGADELADRWAASAWVPVEVFEADWRPGGVFDRSAGHKRNGVMGARLVPELPRAVVVAFPGGPGTAGMCKVARRLRLPLRACCPDHPLPP